eukprot:SAG22_NODE_606_length_8615_cov_6.190348_12_plen_68_part_00
MRPGQRAYFFEYKQMQREEGLKEEHKDGALGLKQHPLEGTPCDFFYEGRLAKDWPNGPTFDSSYKRK